MNENTMKEDLAGMIVEGEWEMFQNVSNIGGRASCQDDRGTFEIMRKSQFLAWDTESLKSYLGDLVNAVAEGRNLPAEKYAWMMESTDPEQFERIREQLPERSPEKLDLIDRISGIHLLWNEECSRKYPRLFDGARPVHTISDAAGVTSSETYWRGELCTFSEMTLKRYLEHALAVQQEGGNLCEEILDRTMKAYGFRSAMDAEQLKEVKG